MEQYNHNRNGKSLFFFLSQKSKLIKHKKKKRGEGAEFIGFQIENKKREKSGNFLFIL